MNKKSATVIPLLNLDNPRGLYILDGFNNVVPCSDLRRWALWYGNSDDARIVADHHENGVHISTIFLAVDCGIPHIHSAPLIWETMIITERKDLKELNHVQWRFKYRDEALNYHKKVVGILTRDYSQKWMIKKLCEL